MNKEEFWKVLGSDIKKKTKFILNDVELVFPKDYIISSDGYVKFTDPPVGSLYVIHNDADNNSVINIGPEDTLEIKYV